MARRFADGLSLGVGYTWSKAMSPNENSFRLFQNAERAGAAVHEPQLRAHQFNRTHNVGITNVWELPFGPGRRWLSEKGVASYILGGWQINNSSAS